VTNDVSVDPADSSRFELAAHEEIGVEVLRASMSRRAFDPHFHERFLIGFTCGGAEAFTQEGQPGISMPGQIRIIEPGAVHTGGPGDDEPWRYVALYVDAEVLKSLAAENQDHPRFDRAVIDDPELFRAGLALAQLLSQVGEPAEREDGLATLVMRLARHRRHRLAELRSEHGKVALAKEYIHQRVGSPLRLDDLAAAVGFSKFHLLRTFKAATGLTPWRYQVQLRLSVARDMLREGAPASQVAVICGFFDQSHFTRLFRASFGITPAAYAAAYRK
jgi:AraC-like DNA-binding protein